MIEWSLSLHDPAVRQPVLQEIDECGLILGTEIAGYNETRLLDVVEVSAATVEVHHVGQRRLATIVEVRSRHADVAQRGCLEGAAVRRRATLRERNTTLTLGTAAEILRGWTDTDIVEALVATIAVDEAKPRGVAHRRVAERRAGMASRARGITTLEDAETPLLIGRQGIPVDAAQDEVHRRPIGDERRLVGLHRLTEDPRELSQGVDIRTEGGGDELAVATRMIVGTTLQTVCRGRRHRAQHAIAEMDRLELQRRTRQHLSGNADVE